MKRETLYRIMKFIAFGISRPVYIGAENLPSTGGVILATNHMSRVDSVFLFLNPSRDDVTALVADKYQKYPFFKWMLDSAGIIWLDRENADFGAIRAAVDVLKRGYALGIAPEGTRSAGARLLQGKAGAALVALRANVPIVPVGIAGTEKFFTKALTFRFPKVYLRFGKPFTLAPLERDRREEQMNQYTEEIMCRIAALMPDQYHGFYAGNPRIAEIRALNGPMQLENE